MTQQVNPDDKTFADYGVAEDICAALAEKGITHPFPIQALTLPTALNRRDIIGQAKTGTGKTLGFAIPILHDVLGPEDPGYKDLLNAGKPQAMVVVPTRELAKQVASDIRDAAAKRNVRITEIYGGKAFEPQIADLERGTDIVVGTPGRMIDLMKRGVLVFSGIRTVVLDEADEMLDLGFLPDVETLLSRVPATRHTMLFSATMPGQVIALARRYMSHPTHIRAQDPDDQGSTVKSVQQYVYRCHSLNKIEVLSRILQAKDRGLTMVFTKTKRSAARLQDDLTERGFAVASLHGDLGQGAREQALRAFRNEKVDVLVATDVAARGIDVDNVTHVVNYQCPDDEKTYLHRIGRTGRAGAAGKAITFVDWEDLTRWKMINKILELNFDDPLETYHTSSHLYTDLDIDESVTGRLPLRQRTRAGLDAEKIEDLGEPEKKRDRAKRGGKRGGRRREAAKGSNSKPRRRRVNKSRKGRA